MWFMTPITFGERVISPFDKQSSRVALTSSSGSGLICVRWNRNSPEYILRKRMGISVLAPASWWDQFRPASEINELNSTSCGACQASHVLTLTKLCRIVQLTRFEITSRKKSKPFHVQTLIKYPTCEIKWNRCDNSLKIRSRKEKSESKNGKKKLHSKVEARLPVSGKLGVKWRRELKFTSATEKRLIPSSKVFLCKKVN